MGATGRPGLPPEQRRGARLASALALAWLALAMLAGCATGDVEEARVAATRAATQPAVLPEAQATNIVKEFFPPTASPGPTPTPEPTLATLTLATSIGANNEPLNEVAGARIGGTIYAVAELHNLRPGQTAVAVWTTADGTEVNRTTVPIDRSLAAAWVPFRWDVGGVAAGQYAVYVSVDDLFLESLVFRLG